MTDDLNARPLEKGFRMVSEGFDTVEFSPEQRLALRIFFMLGAAAVWEYIGEINDGTHDPDEQQAMLNVMEQEFSAFEKGL